MPTRKLVWVLALGLSACAAPTSIMQPDCHSCTTQEQRWEDFQFAALAGTWRGNVEILKNVRSDRAKEKSERQVSLRFLSAGDFFAAQGATCAAVPVDALVLNGALWHAEGAGARTEYEAFLPVEDGMVAYGRVSLDQLNGQKVCHYRRLGRVMGRNRLALPAVTFSEDQAYPGRVVASTAGETELSVEFLRFAPEAVHATSFYGRDARRPASSEDQEKPPLILRVFKVTTRDATDRRGQWKGTEEELFRLWKAE